MTQVDPALEKWGGWGERTREITSKSLVGEEPIKRIWKSLSIHRIGLNELHIHEPLELEGISEITYFKLLILHMRRLRDK